MSGRNEVRRHRDRRRVVACGGFLDYFDRMSVHIAIPDDLAGEIGHVATDREAFVAEAVRRLLRDAPPLTLDEEVARINQFADELNREAEEVLEYRSYREGRAVPVSGG
jgi:hypothetical protein